VKSGRGPQALGRGDRDLRRRGRGLAGLVVAVCGAAFLGGSAPAAVGDLVVSITSGPASSTTEAKATFAWKVNGRGVTATRCQLDGGAAELCRSPRGYAGLAVGAHRFLLRAYSASGVQAGSDAWSWTVVVPSPATTTSTGATSTTTTAPTATTTTSSSPTEPTPTERSTASLAYAIVGTAGGDTLAGTPGPDVILGLGGNDTIHGLGGDDIIVGGGGNDVLFGDAGQDRLDAGPGRDTVHGGDGNDRLALVDGAIDQVVDGGHGLDRVYADKVEPGASGRGIYYTAIEIRYLVASRPIVFTAFTQSGSSLKLMNADGGGVVALLPKTKYRTATSDGSPKWSPDGTRIAFVRSRHVNGTGTSDLVVVNWNGTGLEAVTTTPDLCEQSPSWSPDGTRLAYYVEPCPGEERVAQKALDPAAPVTYVSGENDFEDTEWRADGAYIYAGTCTGAHGGVYRMDAWAANPSTDFEGPPGDQRTPTNGNQCAPELSISAGPPFRLLFQTYSSSSPLKKSDRQIFSKDDGAPPSVWGTNLTFKQPPASFYGFFPDWSSDGKHIVFEHSGIWKMNADGTGKQLLGPGSTPDWR
jgi:hypothetical protein